MASLIYHLFNSGSITQTLLLFNIPSMMIGLANGLSWGFYALAVLRRDHSVDLVMANLLSSMANLNCLVFTWAHKHEPKKAYIAIGLSMLAFYGMFVLQQLDPEKAKAWTFGVIGCLTLFLGHIVQSKDLLKDDTQRAELIAVICNVLPNMLLSVISVVIAQLRCPQQLFIKLSSWANCILYAMEFAMVLRKNFAKNQTVADPSELLQLSIIVNNGQENNGQRGLKRAQRNQGSLPTLKCWKVIPGSAICIFLKLDTLSLNQY